MSTDQSHTLSPFQPQARFRNQLAPSATLQINERIRTLWAEGRTVYHFAFGESRFPVHPLLKAALAAHAGANAYLPVQGLPALRQAIARYYSAKLGTTYTPAQVLVTPGSKAALFAVQMALDADLLLPTPSWVSYGPQARLLGRRVHSIAGSAADDYALTLAAIDAAAQQAAGRPRLLVLNGYNNPTGRDVDPALLAALADYCRANNILILSDEIYALVPHPGETHRSPAQYYPEGTVVVGGLSKHLSLGGWRLGHALLPAGSEALMRALTVIAGEIWSTASAPIQHAAVVAYSGEPAIETYVAECAAVQAVRTRYIYEMLSELGIRCAPPQGAFYLFPNFDRFRAPLARHGVTTSPELAEFLLERYGLALLPGSAFNVPAHELSLRLASSFVDMEDDARAEALLAAWRAERNPERLIADHHPTLHVALEQFRRFVDDMTAAG